MFSNLLQVEIRIYLQLMGIRLEVYDCGLMNHLICPFICRSIHILIRNMATKLFCFPFFSISRQARLRGGCGWRDHSMAEAKKSAARRQPLRTDHIYLQEVGHCQYNDSQSLLRISIVRM